MVTKKVNYKKRFMKFLSDNNLLTEFNRNFKAQEDNRGYRPSIRHRGSFFAKVEPMLFLVNAFTWSKTPEDFDVWSDLDSKWIIHLNYE